MNFDFIIGILSGLSLVQWGVIFVFSLVTGIIGAFSYMRLFYKREKIINDNLKRPIKIFFPPNNSSCTMETEFNLLSKSGLFNVEKPTSDQKDTIRITNHSLVILGCDKNSDHFKKVFEKVKSEKVPILIYTFGDNQALGKEQWKDLYDYPYYSVCNTPLRLVSDVFTLLSTFPKGD